MNIVTLGDTTNGKPTGMNGWDIAAIHKFYFFPVTFQLVNSKYEGNFFDGFFPAKPLTDDITHDWSDRKETCLKEAIHYLETGAISSKGTDSFVRRPQFSEKTNRLNEAIKMMK